MKQLELNLKKRLLIVEVPRLADYEFINKDSKYIKIGDEEIKLNIPTLSKLEIVCKGSELTEDIAKEIVDKKQVFVTPNIYNYVNYKNEFSSCLKALESFISAIEASGYYWGENPIYLDDEESDFDKRHEMRINWEKAKSKTFNPEKTLIFEIL